MSLQKKIAKRRKRRSLRTRKSVIQGLNGKLRVSVFRSLKHIYAQVIDQEAQKTIVSSSSLTISGKQGDKTATAKDVGLELAKRALEKNINEVVFDRGKFAYHGRVKSLAEGLREGGLKL